MWMGVLVMLDAVKVPLVAQGELSSMVLVAAAPDHQLPRQHILPWSGEVPGSGDDCVDEGVAPAWIDGVVGVPGNFEGGR